MKGLKELEIFLEKLEKEGKIEKPAENQSIEAVYEKVNSTVSELVEIVGSLGEYMKNVEITQNEEVNENVEIVEEKEM